jgi:adenylate cyclase
VGTNLCKDYTVMGDVANIASRIQGMAGPGEIIINEEVYEQVKDSFPDAEKQVLEIWGISYPVVAYLLTGQSSE